MIDHKISPDDPKLTAYALGELEEGELAIVDPLVKADPVARAIVDEIRAFAGQLEGALEGEPIQAPSVPSVLKGTSRLSPTKVVRFPYYGMAGLAAACFAAMVIFRENTPRPVDPQEPKRLYEVNLHDEPTPKTPIEKVPADTARSELSNLVGVDEKKPEGAITDIAAPPIPVSSGPESAPLSAPGVSFSNSPTQASVKPEAPASTTPAIPFDAFKPERIDSFAEKLAVVPPFLPTVSFLGEEGARKAPPRAIAGALPAAKSGLLLGPTILAANKKEPAKSSIAEDAIVLSAFSVSETNSGYVGASSLAGSRVPGPGGLPPKAKPDTNMRELRPRLFSTKASAHQPDHNFLSVKGNPLSTLPLGGDITSYANVRRFLNTGQLPPPDAVRIEALINYFPYRYAEPFSIAKADPSKSELQGRASAADNSPIFAASLEVATAPWNPTHRLVRIGLKGRDVSPANRPPANLVFLIDVSRSMEMPNRLPLVKESLRLLLEKLKPTDRLAIVTYAGTSKLALSSTLVAHRREILRALNDLRAGGSKNGGIDIQLAYDVAKTNLVPLGINRIIFCTAGDFNLGTIREGELTRLVGEKAKTGVFFSVLAFGMGNNQDSPLEKLADRGNGHFGYIDSKAEARNLLLDQVSGPLVSVAKDVKLQVEFNPAKASSYRLIGYEDLTAQKENSTNDKIDEGEMGAGHTVTALYEVIPVGAESSIELSGADVDSLKYQSAEKFTPGPPGEENISSEMLTVKVRFTPPTVQISRKVEFPLVDTGAVFAAASEDFKFAAAVAGFGMILRESPHKGTATYDSVLAWAETGQGEDRAGYRREFIELVKKAKSVSAE